jgi:peptidoglycan/LPS O-acetylase OafA/YrhL
MFGILRFGLAYLVLLSHLVGSEYLAHFGFYAVRGFFVMSGFIMTAALNDVYRFDGFRFWVNRLLRLLPLYYVVCILTLAAVQLMPNEASSFLHFWRYENRHHDLLMNFLVLPLQFTEPTFRMVPPYWSIAVELVMYFLLWAFIARREAFAVIAFGTGLVFHVACAEQGFDWGARYFTAPSAVMSFALGAMIYFLRARGALKVGPRVGCVALAAWTVNLVAGAVVLPASWAYEGGYYLGTFCFALVVAGFASGEMREWFSARAREADALFGELAYPFFLLQWLGGFMVAMALDPGTWRGWVLTLVATPIIFCLSYGLAMFNRAFVEPVRTRVRALQPANAVPQVAERAIEG